ncbi:MAG: transcriptional antiterminator [Elusimicrobia bacterium CG08_land_8_20_14_0_20_51_18]|nr:MAG: transcriptional antiterminator [Elusimicrobia bacterium CG08_land_8_20_14_0_20_51_18]
MNLKLLLPLFLAFALAAGCAPEKKELVFAVGGAPSELDEWESVIEDFSREKGIKARLLRQPTDSDQRRQGILIPLKARVRNPDVFLMDIAWIGQFAASGWLEDLNPYINKEGYDLGKFWKNILDSADTFGGELVAMPVYIDAGVLYYRRDLLEKYGVKKVPEHWDEFIAVAARIQEKERAQNPKFFAFVWQGAQYEGLVCDFLEFATMEGGGIGLSGGKIKLDTPANRAAAGLMRDLIFKHKISPPNVFTDMKEEEARLFFQSGNALFERNWPYAWGLHQAGDSPVKGKVGIARIPAFPGRSSVSTLGGWHIGISRFSDAKSEAWEFLKYALSRGTQKKLSLALGWNPARKDVYSDPEVLAKYPHFRALSEVFSGAKSRPQLPYYTQVSDVLQRYLNSAVAAKTDPASAFGSAEKEINAMMERYK